MIDEIKRYLEPVPTWVTEWYPNDQYGQNAAIARYRTPVTTSAERERNAAYLAEPTPETFACSACGKFAFAEPTICFSCRRMSAQAAT